MLPGGHTASVTVDGTGEEPAAVVVVVVDYRECAGVEATIRYGSGGTMVATVP